MFSGLKIKSVCCWFCCCRQATCQCLPLLEILNSTFNNFLSVTAGFSVTCWSLSDYFFSPSPGALPPIGSSCFHPCVAAFADTYFLDFTNCSNPGWHRKKNNNKGTQRKREREKKTVALNGKEGEEKEPIFTIWTAVKTACFYTL